VGSVSSGTFTSFASVWSRCLMVEVPSWFCCLNPTERTVVRDMAIALPLTLFIGVPKAVWDAMWFGASGVNQDRIDSALSSYLLEIVTIPDEETEIDVVVVRPTDLPFWVEASLWILLPAAACLDGCSWFVFP